MNYLFLKMEKLAMLFRLSTIFSPTFLLGRKLSCQSVIVTLFYH